MWNAPVRCTSRRGSNPIGGHFFERRVTDDSGVVDHGVHSPSRTESAVDGVSAFRGGDAVIVGDGRTAPAADLFGGLPVESQLVTCRHPVTN